MASKDAVELALNSPIDWLVFEKLVYEILAQDDFPTIRKIGNNADGGIDAVEQAYFDDGPETTAIIQITSQKTQLEKFRNTVATLRKNGHLASRLVMVFRQPTSSSTRTEIQLEGHKLGIFVDIRDQTYLIAQLSRPNSNIYTRYFDTIGAQVKSLLSESDPLGAVSDPTMHAILAAMGAYVLSPHAQLARKTLFEKTVLATIVSLGESTEDRLLERLHDVLPEEPIDNVRLKSALASLREQKEVSIKESRISPTQDALLLVGQSLASTKQAYDGLKDHVFEKCSEISRLDGATKGYIERNLRRAMLRLVRAYGPMSSDNSSYSLDEATSHSIYPCISSDLNSDVARAAMIAFGSYVEDAQNSIYLASLARSYAALAIRNLDPLGRRWQKNSLSRTVLALDTDAVLYLIIEELPEHRLALRSILALGKAGFKVTISDDVIREAVQHLSRADRTYSKFREQLQRMSPTMIDSQVWHAVVRGFYYFDGDEEWTRYWSRYYDSNDAEGYCRHLIQRKLAVSIRPLLQIPDDWFADLEEISASILDHKERHRLKADFRDDEMKRKRVYDDVRMALNLASYDESSRGGVTRGYMVSEDRAFVRAQNHPRWAPRPQVHIFTHALPQLSGFVCGEVFHDDDIVKLLFDPAISAAAELMKDEITTLTALGVDLRTVGLGRLEWDLKKGLYNAVHGYQNSESAQPNDRLDKAIDVWRAAQQGGLLLEPAIKDLVDSFNSTTEAYESERFQREKVEAAMAKLIQAAGQTKKARRRVNQVLRELGFGHSETEPEDDNIQ